MQILFVRQLNYVAPTPNGANIRISRWYNMRDSPREQP